MKKTKGIVFAAAVLSVLLMVSLAIAAPPGSQPPSSGQAVPPYNMPTGDIVADYPFFCIDNEPCFCTGNVPCNSSPQIKMGDSIKIICNAFVRGCVNTSFHAKIEVDGTSIFEGVIQSPDPLCQMAHNFPNLTWVENIFTTWIAGRGNHTIRCTLDSRNKITEVNETNNTRDTFTIQEPLAIDKIKDIKTKPPIPVPTQRVR